MKRRMILTNSLVVFFSLVALLVVSVLILFDTANRQAERQVKDYLRIACLLFDGNNMEQTASVFTNGDETIRISFIDLQGNLQYDSFHETTLSNHLDRYEILHLGQSCKRYSQTIGKQMLYIADLDGDYYVRIAIPVEVAHAWLNTFLFGGLACFFGIFLLSVALIYSISKKTVASLNPIINRLGRLSDEDLELASLSIDDLPKILELLTKSLESKLSQISNQKEKLNNVLEEMAQGILVLDAAKKVRLINPAALHIFQTEEKTVYRKDVLYLIRDRRLQELIEQVRTKKESANYLLTVKDKSYQIDLKPLDGHWISNGVIAVMTDISEKILLDQTKKEFFANASHELKSPLTSIIGYQQLITEEIETDPQQILDYSKKTIQEAKRMNEIVIDMLNLSKLERQEPKKIERIDASALLTDLLDRFRQRLGQAEITLVEKIENVQLIMDTNHLEELFRNLLDNAIAYNRPSGTIEVELTEEHFVVKDSGIGISEEEQQRVFERFYRAEQAKRQSLGGTGLGLAIVKHIAGMYDFKIKLKSKVGEGTTIEILFQ